MTSTVGAFAQRKAQTLAELSADSGDFSRAGHVDERARPIVGLVNRHPSFFTT
jgi:tRNA wybutosine-synthesizing protein 3